MNHDLTVTGDFTLAGNITLGDASSDTITINADFAGNLIPDADGTRTLGDATNKYATAFIDDVVLGPQGDVQFSVMQTQVTMLHSRDQQQLPQT